MEVWFLLINHRHGVDITIHATQDSAYAGLVQYCRDEWENEFADANPPATPPEDDDELIDQYFENVDDETYEIDYRPVLGPEGKPT